MTSFSKRSFLKGLFVAPAIIAAENLMPVKAMGLILPEEFAKTTLYPSFASSLISGNTTTTKLITDLAEIQEAVNLTTSKWQLYNMNGNLRWMTSYSAGIMQWKGHLVKEMDVPQTNREIDTTVALMKSEPGSAVIWGIPNHFRR